MGGKPHYQDGDESDSKEVEGAVESNKPDPSVPPSVPEPPHKDGNSPDGEEG